MVYGFLCLQPAAQREQSPPQVESSFFLRIVHTASKAHAAMTITRRRVGRFNLHTSKQETDEPDDQGCDIGDGTSTRDHGKSPSAAEFTPDRRNCRNAGRVEKAEYKKCSGFDDTQYRGDSAFSTEEDFEH